MLTCLVTSLCFVSEPVHPCTKEKNARIDTNHASANNRKYASSKERTQSPYRGRSISASKLNKGRERSEGHTSKDSYKRKSPPGSAREHTDGNFKGSPNRLTGRLVALWFHWSDQIVNITTINSTPGRWHSSGRNKSHDRKRLSEDVALPQIAKSARSSRSHQSSHKRDKASESKAPPSTREQGQWTTSLVQIYLIACYSTVWNKFVLC